LDIESHRLNERVKAIAGMCDNASLALFIAAVVNGFTSANLYMVLDVGVGLAL